MSVYTEVKSGYVVEPESCVHDAAARHSTCWDCGLPPSAIRKERELREKGWTVAEIAALVLLDKAAA